MGEEWVACGGGWAVAILTGVLAIKATVRFDVNEWQKERRKQKEERLRSLCPMHE